MPDPIFGTRLTIQCRALDVYIVVRRIEVRVPNCCSTICGGRLDGHGLEVGRVDQVDILPRVGK